MDAASALAAYDARLRVEGELVGAESVAWHGPLAWALFEGRGFVTYRDLGGAEGPALDALVAATVAHFRDDTDVPRFEWKTRGHDLPADLGDRLVAHGLVPEEVETVMIGEASALAGEVAVPDEVTVRRAGDGADLVGDVTRAMAMQDEVFGQGSGSSPERLAADLLASPDTKELWLAEVVGDVVSAGRLEVVPGTGFAGLWGGATRAEWRGRGIYRALTAARARSALRLGASYLQSDCSAMSRPILERSGLVAVTTTTPYVWTR